MKPKKQTHIYADSVMAEEKGKILKFCWTCGVGFLGRPNFCPACFDTEKRLKRRLK